MHFFFEKKSQIVNHHGDSINPDFAERDIWVMLLTSGAIAAMLLNGREIGRRTGLAMVAGYFFYMAYLYL